MSENATKKSNQSFSVKTFVFGLISWGLLLGSYLTYTIVPVSDLANSVDHSGMDAVYVLTAAPVFAAISLVLLVLTLLLNKDYLFKLSDKRIIFGVFGLNAAMVIISIVFSIIFVVSQYDLGFTAPVDGTIYESYGIYILVNVIAQALSLIALSLKMKGIGFIKK